MVDSRFELTYLYKTPYEGTRPRWLFVCNTGVLRSQTAACVAHELGYNSRSCGVESYSLIPLSLNLLHWCDWVVFMDTQVYSRAQHEFTQDEITTHKVLVWDIADSYELMDPELVNIIKANLK